MDTLSFIAAVTEALAWPLATLGIALLFRKQLVDLLRTIKKGKVGPAEFDFEREIKAIESVASGLPSAASQPHAAIEATANPRGAILDAWIKLEDHAIDYALRNDLVRPTARRNPGGAVRGIINSGHLSDLNRQVLEQLKELRDLAAHDPDFNPNPDSVLTYVRLAADIGQQLQQAAQRANYPASS
jgi:hypothetical protein